MNAQLIMEDVIKCVPTQMDHMCVVVMMDTY